MKKLRKERDGSVQIYVIAALVLISVFSAYLIHLLQSDIFQMHAYSLQMQAYYLADEAASAAVSALLADDEASLLATGTYPMHDTMVHTAAGSQIGVSSIDVTKEIHPYYDEDKVWVVIRIETSIPDPRAGRSGEDFSYGTVVMVLADNPLIQLYNIDPNDL